MSENEISYIIRGKAAKIHKDIGPGLLESAYCVALVQELKLAYLRVKTEVPLPFVYGGILLPVSYRLDMVVEEKVIVELKSVDRLAPVHHKQLITYLKLSGFRLGLLINFNEDDIFKGIHRKVNGL